MVRSSFININTSLYGELSELNEEESRTLSALILDGNCAFDFCLVLDSDNCVHNRTNEVISMLLQTNATTSMYEHAQWCAQINALIEMNVPF